MNDRIERALSRCSPVEVTTLAEFLEPVIPMSKEELSRTRGFPNTILVTQFMLYAKSRLDLAEELTLDEEAGGRVTRAVWRNTDGGDDE